MKFVTPRSLLEIKKHLDQREEEILSPFAALSKNAIRRRPDERVTKGHRQNFSIDSDRILHSLAYTRYVDKTQVFYLIDHDHITHRVLHVQLLSKIARTIGRFLHLNEDLIEAIALGHDIGHPPFGHDGERILSEICLEHGLGHFLHNVQSVRFLDLIERKGRGWNLSLQVLDGILCHDGETHKEGLVPNRGKSFDDLDREMRQKTENPELELTPMTLEGCVVRLADTISYIGRDIEDAIRLNLIKREEIPKRCAEILGNTNGEIVYTLVTDLIEHSLDKDEVSFGAVVADALKELRQFNIERIYSNPLIKKETGKFKDLFQRLFEGYLDDLYSENTDSVIYSEFLDGMSEKYISSSSNEEIVRDFIVGMTDDYFLKQCHLRFMPQKLPTRF